MERITIELKSKKKLELVAKILDALDIPYIDQPNPSPSGDKWFLDSDNLKIMNKGLTSAKAGHLTIIKDVNNIWESIL